jgi:DNA-directed RNA polymerase specialized sigma24 family protein
MSATDDAAQAPLAASRAQFLTTHWSVVLAAGETASPQAHEALSHLCRAYWYPLYAWLRRSGRGPHDAQDSLQAFFARLLERKSYKAAAPDRGRFRTFLLTALKNFLADEHDKAIAQKRGGGVPHFSLDEAAAEERYRIEPPDAASPDRLFERKWALALLENTLARLEAEYADKRDLFRALQPHLLGDDDGEPYLEIGRRLNQHYRERLRAEVGNTVERWEDIDEEVRQLFAALAL